MGIQNQQDPNNISNYPLQNLPPLPKTPPSAKKETDSVTAQTHTIAAQANLPTSVRVSISQGTVHTHHLPSSDQAKTSQPSESTLTKMLKSITTAVQAFFKTTSAKIKELVSSAKEGLQDLTEKIRTSNRKKSIEKTASEKSSPLSKGEVKIRTLQGEIKNLERLIRNLKPGNPTFKEKFEKQLSDLKFELEMSEIRMLNTGSYEPEETVLKDGHGDPTIDDLTKELDDFSILDDLVKELVSEHETIDEETFQESQLTPANLRPQLAPHSPVGKQGSPEQEIKNLKAKRDTLKDEISALKANIKNASNEYAQLAASTRREEIRKELADIQTKVSQLKDEIGKREIDDLLN